MLFPLLVSSLLAVDSDGDGLDDSVETNTGIYVSETDTGTDANVADTDSDGVPDGLEITEGTDPNDASDFNSFSTGLVAYYPFDGNANDESGNGHNGIVEGATLAEDKSAGLSAYSFQQVNDKITIPTLTSMDSGRLTVSLWAKQVDYTRYSFMVCGKQPGGINYAFAILTQYTSDLIRASFKPASEFGEVFSNSPNERSIWQHIVYTSNGVEATLLVNGVLQSNAPSDDLEVLISDLVIGNRGTGGDDSNFNGSIDDVRIYDRALSTSEVSALYKSEAPQFQIIEGSFTWQEAKADAEARGGRLAVLDTQDKIDTANGYLEKLGEWTNSWIGLTDEVTEGEWKWINGLVLGTDDWAEQNPEPNGEATENYAVIRGSDSSGWADVEGDLALSYILELVAPVPLAPIVDLDTFYESNSGESITIDATPTGGYPTTYTYQWSYKAVGNSGYFIIPSNFGGTASSYQISGDSGNNGTWKVEVTNGTGTTTAEFNYRVYTDSDSDGLSDGQEEFVLGTDPNDNDSDDDSLLDGVETNTGTWISSSATGTDPLSDDSDNDGLLDGVETNTAEYVDSSDTGTDPNNSDTDGDGLLDGVESNSGTYVDSSDTGTDPLEVDSDGDSIEDGYETATGVWLGATDTGTNPTMGDSDGDRLSDGAETNSGTFVDRSNTGTNPNSTDSDGDGFTDNYEINTSYDPTSSVDTPDAVLIVKTAIELEFHGASGGTYRIEHATDLGSWTTVEDNIQGESALVERLHSVDDYSRRFFRVIRTDQ